MKVKFEYSEELAAINEKLLDMPRQLEDSEDKVLRKIGNAVKKNVVRFLHDSDVETRAKMVPPSNYDGSRPYIHMKDDVRVKLKTDKNGIRYVSIRGGKFTGYKWHFIDQGHISRDGLKFVMGNNFIGRALSASEKDVDAAIDNMVKKVVG